MPIELEAVYENGVLKPSRPLFFREHARVHITIEEPGEWVQNTRGVVPCADDALIQWAALDPDLAYDFGDGP